MPTPASGEISILSVNAEIGNGSGQLGMSWVRDNTYYARTDLGSVRSHLWYTMYSSQNSPSFGGASYSSNCTVNCQSLLNPYRYDSPSYYKEANNSVNCGPTEYSHGTRFHGNCNCNCNCYNCVCNAVACNCNVCDCNCSSGSCLPGYIHVLMADGTWKQIVELAAGDQLRSVGRNATVLGVDMHALGDRQLLSYGDIQFTEEHPFWARLDGVQAFGTNNTTLLAAEIADGTLGDRTPRLLLTGDYEVAHMNGWMRNRASVLETNPEMPVYLVRTGGLPVIANGYLVGMDFGAEHTTFNWEV